MKMKSSHHLFLLSALIIITIQSTPASADHQLRHGYYRNICPNVESIVRSAVSQKVQQTPIAAPGTLRLFFHDCIVRGCDASVMLVSPTGDDERHHPDDLSLAGDGFDTVVKAKTAVDRDPRCANKVSCADILAMAARDVVNLAGGPFYAVELGRLDGKISTKADVEHHVPQPESNLDELNDLFANWNLGQTDVIALSGAHTIGFSHCEKFKERIYGNDPTMDPAYAMKLRQACPLDVGPTAVVDMDPTTPSTLDNAYYRNLQRGLGLFTSDQVLFTDARSRGTVESFASNKTAFEEAFVAAMTKLGRVEVKTGDDDDGEVRRDCSFVN